MKYDSGPPTATLANTTHRLRQLLETRPARGAKDERIRQLRRDLRAYTEQHPKASDFKIDAGRHNRTVWQHEIVEEPRQAPSFVTTATTSTQAAEELVDLCGDVDSFTSTSLVALVNGNLQLARSLVERGVAQHGGAGYASNLLVSAGMIEQLQGRGHDAICHYRAAFKSPVAAARRSALAAGTFAAATSGQIDELDWMLVRMWDEDEGHQRAILQRVAQLRRQRLGDRSVAHSERLIAERGRTLTGAPSWALEPSLTCPDS